MANFAMLLHSKKVGASGLCSDVFCVDRIDAGKTGAPTVGRRFCAVRAFWPGAKTSAQAEFISAEH